MWFFDILLKILIGFSGFLVSFFEKLEKDNFFWEISSLFAAASFYDNIFMKFLNKHFFESCLEDWMPSAAYLELRDDLFFQQLLEFMLEIPFFIKSFDFFFFTSLIIFFDAFLGDNFFVFFYYLCFFFKSSLQTYCAPFIEDFYSIDNVWAFLVFVSLFSFFRLLSVKDNIFPFLVYYRKKSKLLELLCKNMLLDYHDFSVFHDWHRIFKNTWGSRYTYVEIIDDFITYWYRVYRRTLRKFTYPLPCCKRIALFLKKNFYFVRTRTWIILIGIIIAFIIWSLTKYSYRKSKRFFIALYLAYFYSLFKKSLQVLDFDHWDLLFQDPATVYAHALIDLHDLTMWYIFVVLGLVCWSLYAILKNCVWNISNKNFGSSRVFYDFKIFSRLESCFVFLWFHLYMYFVKDFFDWCSRKGTTTKTLIYYYLKMDKSFDTEVLAFFCGPKAFVMGMYFPRLYLSTKLNFRSYLEGEVSKGRQHHWKTYRVTKITLKRIYFYVRERYLDYRLFNISTYGECFYDSFSELLAVRRFRHSTLLEIIWASIPTVIIVLILIPSLYLLYSAEEDLDPEFTLKVMGHQWYWSYEYTDNFNYFFGHYKDSSFKNFKFDSYLVLEDDLKLGEKRLLEVSNRIVLPTNVVLRILVSSGDVLHAWAVPEMGIKIDAVPGRLNQTLSIILRPGVFYGQCSELCGVAHGFMPIVVHAVTPREFGYWGFWQI